MVTDSPVPAIMALAECGDEIERLRTALILAERALRDQPMQAFQSAAARRRRAKAIDAARAALGQEGGDSDG